MPIENHGLTPVAKIVSPLRGLSWAFDRHVSARSHEGVVGASCPCRTIHGMTRTPVKPSQVAQPLRGVLRRLPAKACLAASFGLLVVGLAIYMYSGESGNINLICRHNLRTADLSVFVDGRPQFSDQISGTVKKRFGIFDKKVEGTFSKTFTTSLGEHVVRVHLQSTPERFDQTRQIGINLVSGKEATVSITAQNGDLSLAYRGSPVNSVNDDSQSYYSGPLRSILVAVTASAVSAAIGFIVQEFLRTRKA